MAAVPVVVVIVESVRGAEEVSHAAALSVAKWKINVPRLLHLDTAPRMLELLEALREPAPPRLGWVVAPIEKLRVAVRLNALLRLVRKMSRRARGHIGRRGNYHRLRELGRMVRATAFLLPSSSRAIFVRVANRVRRVASRGIRAAEAKIGMPLGRVRHHLIGLHATVKRHQAGPVALAETDEP